MKLPFSRELAFPDDVVTQTLAFLARKGAGKTYAAGKLVELLLELGVQCVVIDTVGNWYGLRIAGDGQGKGFDVVVLGGLRGDIPLEPDSGALVADLVADTRRSFVIDISQFSLADRRRFATAFAERLWSRKKAELEPVPLHLVLEESQLLIPQRVMRGEERMVGVFEEIVRLGRNYGIGVSLISQRPQSVNKEALSQAECLVVLQISGAHERKALREWMDAKGVDPRVLAELPSLPVGVAYIWSPQWLRVLKRVHVGKKKTLDSSATPRMGTKLVRSAPAPLDLSHIRRVMDELAAQREKTGAPSRAAGAWTRGGGADSDSGAGSRGGGGPRAQVRGHRAPGSGGLHPRNRASPGGRGVSAAPRCCAWRLASSGRRGGGSCPRAESRSTGPRWRLVRHRAEPHPFV